MAAQNGHIEIIKLCIDNKANINAHYGHKNKKTPLYLAAQKGYLEIVKLLLKHGAKFEKFNVEEIKYLTSLHSNQTYLYNSTNNEIYKEDTQKVEDCKQILQNCQKLLSEIQNNNTSTQLQTLNDLDVQLVPTTSIILAAVKYNNTKFIQHYLNIGLDLTTKYEGGNTILHMAVQANNIAACKLLMKYGANVYTQNNAGQSALNLAVQHNKTEIIGNMKKNQRKHGALVGAQFGFAFLILGLCTSLIIYASVTRDIYFTNFRQNISDNMLATCCAIFCIILLFTIPITICYYREDNKINIHIQDIKNLNHTILSQEK